MSSAVVLVMVSGICSKKIPEHPCEGSHAKVIGVRPQPIKRNSHRTVFVCILHCNLQLVETIYNRHELKVKEF